MTAHAKIQLLVQLLALVFLKRFMVHKANLPWSKGLALATE